MLSDYLQELYEERAAIMEFDGGLSRKETQEKAWIWVITLNAKSKPDERQKSLWDGENE